MKELWHIVALSTAVFFVDVVVIQAAGPTPGTSAKSLFDVERVKRMSTMYGKDNYEVAANDDYITSFMESGLYFNILLIKKPLGLSRSRAEDRLIDVIGLPKEELCKLNIFVGAQPSLDSKGPYGYGLSFCPGSVPLPMGMGKQKG